MSASGEGYGASLVISKKPVVEEAQVLAPVPIYVMVPENCGVAAVKMVNVGAFQPCHNSS